MTPQSFVECFSCHRLVEIMATVCPFCGASIVVDAASRAFVRDVLRQLAVVALGGAVIATAVVAMMDGWRTAGPVLVLVACLAGILWLWADRLAPPAG